MKIPDNLVTIVFIVGVFIAMPSCYYIEQNKHWEKVKLIDKCVECHSSKGE